MIPDMPIEFVVAGTPVSLQGSPASKNAWKAIVKRTGEASVPLGAWALTDRVAVSIYYFPQAVMQGDVDNIVKPILDAMCGSLYVDDHQIERVLVQKFEPDNIYTFSSPSATLLAALLASEPVVYVRVTDDPHEELE